MGLLISCSVPANDQEIINKLKSARSDLEYKILGPSDIPGFFELQIGNDSNFYVSSDGKFLLDGDVYLIGDGDFSNVKESKFSQVRKIAMSKINKDDLIDKLYTFIAMFSRLANSYVVRTQTGYLRWYALSVACGLVIILVTGVLL